jgi:uncharacterized membrane protein (DUF4010 family)
VLARYLAAPFIAGLGAVALAWRSLRGSHAEGGSVAESAAAEKRNRADAVVSVVLYVVYYVRQWVGDAGLMVTGFVLGLTDVDALTLSMTRSVATGLRSRWRAARF